MDDQGNFVGTINPDDWCNSQGFPPSEHSLGPAYPNPFSSSGTTIPMGIFQTSNVRLSVLDRHGRVVDWISYDQMYNPNTYHMHWIPPVYLWDVYPFRVKMVVENNGFECYGDIFYDD